MERKSGLILSHSQALYRVLLDACLVNKESFTASHELERFMELNDGA